MTIQEDMVALLAPVAPIYGGTVQQSLAGDYITYQRIPAEIENILDGPPPIEHTHMQIDTWSMSYAGAQALAVSIRGLMATWIRKNVELREHDLYENETKRHRVSMDFSIWHYN